MKKRKSFRDYEGIWKGDLEIDEIYDEILGDRHKQEERTATRWQSSSRGSQDG